MGYAAGESYLTAHHVQVGEQGSSYQVRIRNIVLSADPQIPHTTPPSTNNMKHFYEQTYVTAQNDLSHHPLLPPPDVSFYEQTYVTDLRDCPK